MFDSLAYLKKLEAVGISRAQAEVQVGAMVEALNTNFATKEDVARVELSIRTDFAKLRSEFADLQGHFLRLEAKVDQMEHRIFVKTVASMTALLILQSAIVHFLK